MIDLIPLRSPRSSLLDPQKVLGTLPHVRIHQSSFSLHPKGLTLSRHVHLHRLTKICFLLGVRNWRRLLWGRNTWSRVCRVWKGKGLVALVPIPSACGEGGFALMSVVLSTKTAVAAFTPSLTSATLSFFFQPTSSSDVSPRPSFPTQKSSPRTRNLI